LREAIDRAGTWKMERWSLKVEQTAWEHVEKEFKRISWLEWRVEVSKQWTLKERSLIYQNVIWSVVHSERIWNVDVKIQRQFWKRIWKT